jgi:23S rRNA (cytidine1920-2'-O)/16S rRNA (cytidine1409-2'-O)-methyltransferase
MTPSKKIRLDVLLVERGLADSREKAQRMIRAGQVRIAGRALDKPGHTFDPDIALEVEPLRDRFVSRGGWKLEAAFEAFPGLTPCPAVCADIGASTGGFTDCLLQHGARRVYAIDVGAGQIDQRLREDPRVVLLEKTNARYLTAQSLPEPVGLVVGDVSFISLELILGPAVSLLGPEARRETRGDGETQAGLQTGPGAEHGTGQEAKADIEPHAGSEARYGAGQIVVLVKPQFEAGPERVGKGGVVRDPQTHRDVLRRIILEFAPTLALRAAGLIPSPIKGPAGNREYLVWLTRAQFSGAETLVAESRIDAAVKKAFEL